ncbi:MAG: hypothetical protein EZS28_041495 [Streblomastix strix]|uniref:Uncharacterized protein n=1 Tax=Streblomastix strix TaxID=222440 RepID=A0A5J4TXZ5_9EUKA|nr:MAG: hypothetical protein EZS28_041495 [Streblomastix strix]
MEYFIATVMKARQGFDNERTVEQKEPNGQLSQLYYKNVIYSVNGIEQFIRQVYEEQHHQAFKIQFNFGVIYEEYKDTRIQEHAPKVIQNEDDFIDRKSSELEIITIAIWKQQQRHYILIYVSPLKA